MRKLPEFRTTFVVVALFLGRNGSVVRLGAAERTVMLMVENAGIVPTGN